VRACASEPLKQRRRHQVRGVCRDIRHEIWRKQITAFASEIITGEYAVNFDEYQKAMLLAYEINDPQLMFDTFADSMVGAIRLAQEGKI
jgi:hypothetical protein